MPEGDQVFYDALRPQAVFAVDARDMRNIRLDGDGVRRSQQLCDGIQVVDGRTGEQDAARPALEHFLHIEFLAALIGHDADEREEGAAVDGGLRPGQDLGIIRIGDIPDEDTYGLRGGAP